MNFLTTLLLTTTIIYAANSAETAPTRAKSFASAVGSACSGKPLTCLEPFLHQDFKFINANGTLNRAEYIKLLSTRTADISAFDLKIDAATDAPGAQVKLPVHAGGSLKVYLFLVADAKVAGGEAIILVDKKNV
ncbi:unnamed protein product [Caenorhabditis angaria]|uniref:Uncharacterized protein n=1 Tax=Caenorhabditis angaria TaxID=860376 RepID=A0A9P1MUE4_9PELO|nr:unnamed protein product [Caenorhabditis angaria]